MKFIELTNIIGNTKLYLNCNFIESIFYNKEKKCTILTTVGMSDVEYFAVTESPETILAKITLTN